MAVGVELVVGYASRTWFSKAIFRASCGSFIDASVVEVGHVTSCVDMQLARASVAISVIFWNDITLQIK
jgi:hypothetical protein